jgi:hypothetical protein
MRRNDSQLLVRWGNSSPVLRQVGSTSPVISHEGNSRGQAWINLDKLFRMIIDAGSPLKICEDDNIIDCLEEKRCIDHIIIFGISTCTFHLHFSRLYLSVFVRFCCIRSFLKPHESPGNVDSPFETSM